MENTKSTNENENLVEVIENALDAKEEEEEAEFDKWFKSYVNSDEKEQSEKRNESHDDTENKEVEAENIETNDDENKEVEQIENVETNDENKEAENVEPNVEIEQVEEKQVSNEVENESEEKHEIGNSSEETKTEGSNEKIENEVENKIDSSGNEQIENSNEVEQIENEENKIENSNEETRTENSNSNSNETEQIENSNEQVENSNEETKTEIQEVSNSDSSTKPSVDSTVSHSTEGGHRRKVKKSKKQNTSSISINHSEQPIQTKEFQNASISIGEKSNEPPPSDEEVLEKIKKSKEKLVNDINEQVKEMEKNGNCKYIDPNSYTIGSDLSNVFYQYIIGKMFVPRNCAMTLDINEYINNTTIFKYNAFDSPNVGIQHPIPEKVIYMNKLNKLFNYTFSNPSSGDFHFSDLDTQITSFLYKYKDLGTTKLEYGMIKSLMGKLIICLNTSCELALRDNTKPRINSEFKQAIIHDIECMKYIQNQDGKLYVSWKTFLNALLSMGPDNLIYVHDNYVSLNTKLKTAYDKDFLTENLLANALKCYLPSVAINYFYAIKSIYLISRLLSIYIQNKLYLNKEFSEVVNDIYTIAVSGVIIYENKSFIFKQTPRSLPKYDKEITEQTKMYILNHLLTGGQYYILKMFEESLPIVASLLTQNR